MKGKVLYVDLEAKHATEVKIASPWKRGETLTVKLAAGEKRHLEPETAK